MKCASRGRWHPSPPCPWGDHSSPVPRIFNMHKWVFPVHHTWLQRPLPVCSQLPGFNSGFISSWEGIFLNSHGKLRLKEGFAFFTPLSRKDKVLVCFYALLLQPYLPHHRAGKVCCSNKHWQVACRTLARLAHRQFPLSMVLVWRIRIIM